MAECFAPPHLVNLEGGRHHQHPCLY